MGNILYDDEESLRHTLGRVLRQAGYEVTTAGEGQRSAAAGERRLRERLAV